MHNERLIRIWVLPFAKNNATTVLNDVVRILVPKDLATGDHNIVLLSREQGSAVGPGL